MSRKPRICFEKAFYHVTNRGDNKEKIFCNDSDRKRMVSFLKKAKEKYCFKLHAFVLMRNHFHLVIETSTVGTISQIMHSINTNYTKYFNWSHNRTGHLFQGRFNSNLIDKDAYLLEVSRYVNLNPVRAGFVERPEHYKWSSYLTYLGQTNYYFIDTELILNMMSDDPAFQSKLYSDFVSDGLRKDFKEFRWKLYKGLLAPATLIEK